MESIRQDLLYAARQYKRTKALTFIVIITFALGIGANTALFSVINGVLLSPLSYPRPEQLMSLHQSKINFATGAISYPDFRDWQKQNHTFSAIAISRPVTFSLTGAGDAVQLNGEYVTSDFFSILGVNPVSGRTFASGEDEVGAAPVALISEALWRKKFNGTPLIAGQPITLDGKILQHRRRGFLVVPLSNGSLWSGARGLRPRGSVEKQFADHPWRRTGVPWHRQAAAWCHSRASDCRHG